MNKTFYSDYQRMDKPLADRTRKRSATMTSTHRMTVTVMINNQIKGVQIVSARPYDYFQEYRYFTTTFFVVPLLIFTIFTPLRGCDN